MDRDIAVALLDQLHAAQNEFYGGGGDALLRDLLASDIAWTVPWNNSIAGVYRGTEAVFDYFRRRDLAAGTFRMTRRDVLAGEATALRSQTEQPQSTGWSTVGLCEVVDKRMTACWLLPLNPTQFEASCRYGQSGVDWDLDGEVFLARVVDVLAVMLMARVACAQVGDDHGA